ncbi:MAG: hypothetical protein ACN4GR_02470 [Arenicellales bacterium]
MALDYTSKIDGDLLSVTTRGSDDSVDEAVAYGESIIRLCIENQCNKVIVDERELTGVLDKVMTYEMVQRLLSLVPYHLRIAYVINPDYVEDVSFGVLVAENRGIHVKAFLSMEPAREWVMQRA